MEHQLSRHQRIRTSLNKIVKEKPFDNHIRATQTVPRGGLIILRSIVKDFKVKSTTHLLITGTFVLPISQFIPPF